MKLEELFSGGKQLLYLLEQETEVDFYKKGGHHLLRIVLTDGFLPLRERCSWRKKVELVRSKIDQFFAKKMYCFYLEQSTKQHPSPDFVTSLFTFS